jgi:hypothetical protein
MRALLVAMGLGLIACGGTDVSGTWKGVGTFGGQVTVKLTLDQNDEQVTGTGNLSGPGGFASVAVSGSAKDEAASLILTAPGFSSPSNYDANVSGDTMTGTWTEPGNTWPLTLNRQ